MNSLNILIIEDELITAIDLQETLEEAGHRITGIVSDRQEALLSAKANPPDLAIIDIHLGDSAVDGISIAKELVAHHQMPIIYLTANSESEMVRAARETLPIAYLLKPFRHDELKIQVQIAYHYFQSNFTKGIDSPVTGYLYLPSEKGYEKIDPANVLYVEADGAYVKIHMINRKMPYHISTNLSHIEQYFLSPNFYRLSRSLLVNLNYLERLEHNQLFLANNTVPMSIPYVNRKELAKKLTIVRTR